MPENANEIQNKIEDKLEYIGLDLQNIPEILKQNVNLNYKISKEFDDSTYKVYKYVSIKDLQIFVTPVQRLTNLKEKYKLSTHISQYLQSEDNKYKELEKALSNTKIEDIEDIAEEQKLLEKNIPWNVKYKNNFKWQIYYSKDDDKYFMLAPLNEKDNAALFYVLKEKINCIKSKKDKKIYIPICQEEYSSELLTKQEITEIENYLWFFTKKWPSIYEIIDSSNLKTIQIVGKTNVYESVQSDYKIILKDREEAEEKYKLMKALFIISSDLKNLYSFDSDVNEKGFLQFVFEDKVIEFKDLEMLLKKEVDKQLDKTRSLIEESKELENNLIDLKEECERKNQEYTNKEKQIVMFLQCKKTFIGRFKYFFKSKKSKKKVTIKSLENLPKIIDYVEDENITPLVFEEKDRYTIEDLIDICHILEKNEAIYKDKVADIKALEEKINILNKKIENSDLFIQEIENHKRSIFEFWKFTNKDLPNALTEAEKLKQEQKNKLKKKFCYENDIKDLGEKVDELQKKKLSKNEIDSLYVAKDYVDIINILYKSELSNEDNAYITTRLKQEKQKYEEENKNKKVIYFDIFGNIDKKPEKVKKKIEKEKRTDKYEIIGLDSKTNIKTFKEELNKYKKILEKEYSKITTPCDISVYCLLNQNTMSEWSIANINPLNIINRDEERDNIDIIKYNIPEGASMLFYTNCILYKGSDIEPGIDLEAETLLYLNKFDRELKGKLKRRISTSKSEYENKIKNIKIYEYDLKPKEVNDDK